MPIPVILVNGLAPPPLGSKANGTFADGATVTLSVASTAGIDSIEWRVSAPNGSSAALANATPSYPFSADLQDLAANETCLITCIANGDPKQVARAAICVPSASGLRTPRFGETSEWDPADGIEADWRALVAKAEAGGFSPPGTSSQLIAGDGSAVTVGSGLTLSGGTLAASGGGLVGAYAARPAAGTAGRRYVTTDGPVAFVDSGAAWRPEIGGKLGAQPPAVAGWTALGSPGTVADQAGAVVLASAGAGGSEAYKALVRTWPVSNRVTAHLRLGWVPADLPAATATAGGIVLRESGTGKLVAFGALIYANRVEMYAVKMAGLTTFDAFYAHTPHPGFVPSDMWLRAEVTGGNRVLSYSVDGVSWTAFYAVGATDYVAPDQAGIFVDPINQATTLLLDSWDET